MSILDQNDGGFAAVTGAKRPRILWLKICRLYGYVPSYEGMGTFEGIDTKVRINLVSIPSNK